MVRLPNHQRKKSEQTFSRKIKLQITIFASYFPNTACICATKLPVPTKTCPFISRVILKAAKTSVVSVHWYFADGYSSLMITTTFFWLDNLFRFSFGLALFCCWFVSNTSLVKSSFELDGEVESNTLQLSGNCMKDFRASSAALRFANFLVFPVPMY